MQFSESVVTGSLVKKLFDREIGRVTKADMQNIVLQPSLSNTEIYTLRYYIRALLYFNVKKDILEWLETTDFDNIESITEREIFSEDNIRKYIFRGFEKYVDFSVMGVYVLDNAVEDVFNFIDSYGGGDTIFSEIPARIVEQLFFEERDYFYIMYENKGKEYKIKIPKREDCINTLEGCAEDESNFYKELLGKGSRIVSLLFLYMLGIQTAKI